MKKSILFIFIFAILIALTLVPFNVSASYSTIIDFKDAEYKDSYSIGETLYIKKIEAYDDNEPILVYAQLQKSLDVIKVFNFSRGDESFVLTQEGDYTLVYIAKDTYNKYHTKSYEFSVGNFDFIDISFENEYSFSEFVNVKAKAIIDSKKVDSTYKVTSPSGQTVELENGGFYPREEGEYTIEYTAKSGDKELHDHFTFNAIDKGITDLFIKEKGVKDITSNVDAPSYAVKGNGVRISTNNETAYVRYKNIIDLNSISKEQNIIRVLPLSTEDYTLTGEIHVRLIDIYDENNTVEYFAYPMYYPYYPGKPDWSHCYVNYDGRTLARNNDGDNKVRNNYGSTIPVHFSGQMLDGTMRSGVEWIELQVDYPERQFLCLGYAFNPTQYCILDTDDSTQVGLGKEWKGFTTGEVYMEIYFVGEGENSAILISEIAGQSLSGNEIKDTTEPYILIDKYDKVAPNGSVGIRYQVPSIHSLLDLVDGVLDESTLTVTINRRKVLGYYADPIVLKDDLSFIPDEEGEYTITYSIKDKTGNERNKTLKLNVLDNKEFSVEIDSLDRYSIGEKFYLPKVNVNCYTDIKEEFVSYSFNSEELDNVALDEVSFNKEGTLLIKYRFVSYSGDVLENTKSIDIVKSNVPIIEYDTVPDYVLKGKTLYLPSFDAIDYSKEESDPNRFPTKYYLVNGVRKEYTDREYLVSSLDDINIKLCAGEGKKEFNVKVVDAKYLSDYFIKDNEVEELNLKGYLEYKFDKPTKFTFVNPLISSSAYGLNVSVGLDSDLDTDKKFRITFTDSIHKELKIYVDCEYVSGNYYMTLNGGSLRKEAKTYISNGNLYMSLTLNNITSSITGAFNIETYSNGKTFDGFKSNLVTLEIEFSDISNKTGLCVYNIGGKSFESYFNGDVLEEYDDISMPNIVYLSSLYEQEIKYESKIIVPKAQSYSVLSGRYSVLVTAISPNGGEIFKDLDASVEHEITLDTYGSYFVRYTVISSSGLKRNYSHELVVSKDETPTFTMDKEFKNSYSKGEEITIPVIRSMEEIDVFITISTPYGKYIKVDENQKIVLNETGNYLVQVMINNKYHYYVYTYEFEVK